MQSYSSASFSQTISCQIFENIIKYINFVLKINNMTGQGYEELIILNRKLDELFNRYNNLKTELVNLRNGNEELKAALQERETRIKELELKYERVKLSGALLGEGENALEAKRKINDLVREIDRCVALLNR